MAKTALLVILALLACSMIAHAEEAVVDASAVEESTNEVSDDSMAEDLEDTEDSEATDDADSSEKDSDAEATAEDDLSSSEGDEYDESEWAGVVADSDKDSDKNFWGRFRFRFRRFRFPAIRIPKPKPKPNPKPTPKPQPTIKCDPAKLPAAIKKNMNAYNKIPACGRPCNGWLPKCRPETCGTAACNGCEHMCKKYRARGITDGKVLNEIENRILRNRMPPRRSSCKPGQRCTKVFHSFWNSVFNVADEDESEDEAEVADFAFEDDDDEDADVLDSESTESDADEV